LIIVGGALWFYLQFKKNVPTGTSALNSPDLGKVAAGAAAAGPTLWGWLTGLFNSGSQSIPYPVVNPTAQGGQVDSAWDQTNVENAQ
jgi:hypothetical protein